MLNDVEQSVLMSQCIRWKFEQKDAGFTSHLQIMQFPSAENKDEELSYSVYDICYEYSQIEFIIIPDRYLSNEEIIQTLHVRHDAHLRKNRIAFVFSSSDMSNLLSQGAITSNIFQKVYKISTIRHGFITESCDENKMLILDLAKQCVATQSSILKG